nr:hypothetical protein [Acidimicrobiales bacterium]
MRFCTWCNGIVPDEARVCASCGRAPAQQAAPTGPPEYPPPAYPPPAAPTGPPEYPPPAYPP